MEELIPTGEFTPVICDGGATLTLSSSFENCTDCQPKTVEIKTAEGGDYRFNIFRGTANIFRRFLFCHVNRYISEKL